MRSQKDFVKITYNKQLLGAVNLNYMFPVPAETILPITSHNIDTFVNFDSERDKKIPFYDTFTTNEKMKTPYDRKKS